MSDVIEEEATEHGLAPVDFGKHFKITADGLVVTGEPDYRSCERLWARLLTMHKGIQFAMGDAAKYFRKRFGEKADQILAEATGWSFETMRTYEWTSDKVLPETRQMAGPLTYSHHQAVGKLSAHEQSQWLDKAATGDGEKPWSVAKLKSAMKEADAVEVNYWLQVKCKSEDDREKLQKRLESQGYITALRGA